MAILSTSFCLDQKSIHRNILKSFFSWQIFLQKRLQSAVGAYMQAIFIILFLEIYLPEHI